MKARLTVVDPRSQEPLVVVTRLPATLGRGQDATIRLDDCWVSRFHCALESDGNALVVRDLGSKHGTLVNRRSVSNSVLMPDDELTIGLTSVHATLECESSDIVAA